MTALAQRWQLLVMLAVIAIASGLLWSLPTYDLSASAEASRAGLKEPLRYTRWIVEGRTTYDGGELTERSCFPGTVVGGYIERKVDVRDTILATLGSGPDLQERTFYDAKCTSISLVGVRVSIVLATFVSVISLYVVISALYQRRGRAKP